MNLYSHYAYFFRVGVSSDRIFFDSIDCSIGKFVDSLDSSNVVFVDSFDSSVRTFIDSIDSSNGTFVNSSAYSNGKFTDSIMSFQRILDKLIAGIGGSENQE